MKSLDLLDDFSVGKQCVVRHQKPVAVVLAFSNRVYY